MRQNAKKRSLIIEATNVNKGMIVDNEINFADWHADK